MLQTNMWGFDIFRHLFIPKVFLFNQEPAGLLQHRSNQCCRSTVFTSILCDLLQRQISVIQVLIKLRDNMSTTLLTSALRLGEASADGVAVHAGRNSAEDGHQSGSVIMFHLQNKQLMCLPCFRPQTAEVSWWIPLARTSLLVLH